MTCALRSKARNCIKTLLKISVCFHCKSDSRPFNVILFTKHLFLKNNTQMFLLCFFRVSRRCVLGRPSKMQLMFL